MNIADITNEITALESAEANWGNVQRLAWLYTVYDHLSGDSTPQVTSSRTVSIMPVYGGEFGEACSGKSIDNIMQVLTEHFAVIKILHAKEYQAVINKIKESP